MANLYSDTVTNLYSGLEPTEITPQPPANAGRQARLAAIANIDVSGNSLIQSYDELSKQYADVIEARGDQSVRWEAAANQQVRELEGLNNLAISVRGIDESGEVQKAVQQAAVNVMANTIEERQKYALEQQAVENIQNLAAQGDYVQAKLLLNNLELGDVDQRLRDIDTKRLILMREIENAEIAKEDQGWFANAADFVLDFLPLNRSMGQAGNVDIDQGLKHWYDGLFSGQRLRNEASSLWNMDPATFSDYVKTSLIPNLKENSTLLGYTSNSEFLDLIRAMADTPMAGEVNAFNAIDNVGLIPSIKGLKPLTSIPSIMIRQGARKEAGELMSKAIIDMSTEGVEEGAKRTGIEAAEVIDNIAPTSVNINGKISQVPLTGEVNAAMERAEALLSKLPELQETTRFLADSERQAAIDTVLKDLQKEFGRELKDVKVQPRSLIGDMEEIELAGGSKVYRIELTVGKKNGAGYAREKDARNYANSLGYDNAKVFRDESGQWFVTIQRDMREQGFYTNPLKVQEDSWAWRVLRGARHVGDTDLGDLAQVSGNKRAALFKQVIKPYADQMNVLKPYEREAITQVMTKGSNAERWFTNDQVHMLMQRAYGRQATQNELNAYQAYRDINDIEWALRNDEVYKQKVIKGFESASFETPLGPVKDQNVLVNRTLDSVPRSRVFDVDNNVHYTKSRPLTQADLERLKSQGYMLIQTENAIRLSDGTYIKSFLVKGRNVSLKPVSRMQLAYRAGGHRMYKGKYFAKQARRGQQPDTGEEFLMAPGTHITGTRKEVQAWVDKMEQARLLYKKQLDETGAVDIDAIDEIFEGSPAFPNGGEFVDMIENGTFNKDAPFETLFDRELPSVYRNTDPETWGFSAPESGFEGYMQTNGRMYYSARGEQLRDWKGDLAPTLDPFETVDRALTNIANITSFSDYKMSSIERWVKQYGRYTNLGSTEASDMVVFRDGILDKTNDRIFQAAKAQRDIIRRNLGWKSDFDLQVEQFTRRLHEWVYDAAGAEAGTRRAKALDTITDWWDNKNPVMALRGLAFDMKLGLFNVAQLPLQIGTAMSATMLSPVHGMHGWLTLIPLRGYLTRSGTEHMLNTLTERGLHKAAGFGSEAEFKEMFRSAKRSGFFNIGGSHQLINDYGPNASISNFGRNIDKVREAGRFFFNEAEMWNRGVAWHIAWKEVKAANPGMSFKSPDFLRKVAGRAEDYSFQMSETSGAVWQKGLMSVPTQFWAYQARMIEALLGKTFTTEQKLRLMVGQTFLWGSAGLPFLPWAFDQYKKANAPEVVTGESFDSFFKVADRGLLDWAIYNMSGVDAQLGEKYGTGSWISDTISDIFGMGEYGEKSPAEMVGGATFNIMVESSKTFLDVFHHMFAESGSEGVPPKPEAFKRLAMNITTASNAIKAYHLFNYGTYLSNKGNTVAAGLPSETGYAALLGFQPGQYDAVETMMSYRNNQQEIVNDAASIVSQYRTRMINEPDNRQALAEEVRVFMSTLPPDVREKVLRRTNRTYDKSMYHNLLKQMEQERQKIAMTETN